VVLLGFLMAQLSVQSENVLMSGQNQEETSQCNKLVPKTAQFT